MHKEAANRCRLPLFVFRHHPSNTLTTSAGGGKPNTPDAVKVLDFSNYESAFKHKSTMELVRAYCIFNLCRFRPLVMHGESLLKVSNSVFGATITNGIVRHSFFNHFCGGEDEVGILPVVHRLRTLGVGGILDYAAEADLEADNTNSGVNDTVNEDGVNEIAPDAVVARRYEYRDEMLCDVNRDIFIKCVRAVKDATPNGGFAAIKLTALGNPLLLERMSTCLLEIRRLFKRFTKAAHVKDEDENNGKKKVKHIYGEDCDGHLSFEAFKKGFVKYFSTSSTSDEEIKWWFHKFAQKGNGFIDSASWISSLHIEHLEMLIANCKNDGPLKSAALTREELKLMQTMKARFHSVVMIAKEMKVRLMVDAEHSYFQPAIDNYVLEAQKEYNKDFPTVFNTYQCYLKDSYDRLCVDLERANREDFVFGAKLVRGAYMVLERQRAETLGYTSPIHNSLEDTHRNYSDCLGVVLQEMKKKGDGKRNAGVNVMVASHNQESCEHTLQLMKEYNIDPATGGVYFGQLLGMADHLTFILGQNGYKSFKYIPYGALDEVIPYLLRRAQENSDMMGGVGKEMGFLRQEIKRRIGLGSA